MPFYRQVALAIALVSALSSGCKSADKPAQSSSRATRLYAVTADSAGFFRRGPQDGRDPDLRLPKDTVVKLIRPSFGYSKVQVVASGEQGYVASEEIGPATSTLLAAATAPPTGPVTTDLSSPAAEQFNLDSNDPRLVPPPEELPGVDLPAPAPTP